MREHIMSGSLPYGPGNGPSTPRIGYGRTLLDTRACPVPGCDAVIGATRLTCRRHWYQVPKPVRDEVWAAWRSGAGAFTSRHRRAVRRALDAASERTASARRPAQNQGSADPAA
jgi:hypothetical protein